jgi:hypothetical protein
MRGAAAAHAREMALLRMEIDRCRTAAELEQIRATLQQIRGVYARPWRVSESVSVSVSG